MEIICLGDSVTFGYGVRRSQCWVSLLGQALGCETVNLGVPGDTTSGMLARLTVQVMPRLAGRRGEEAPVVLIMGGANDIFYAGTDTGARANLGGIVHQLLCAGGRPVVLSPLPICLSCLTEQWQTMVHPGDEALLCRYADWLNEFCRIFALPYIDLRDVLRDESGQLCPELYLEGLHPNPEGHRCMTRHILAALPDDMKGGVRI